MKKINKLKKTVRVLSLFLLVFGLNSPANDLFIQKGHFSITYDSLSLPNNENLGLLGTSYLYDFQHNIYFGIGVYSAVTGERGGFFTGGVELGKKIRLYKNIYTDFGLFVGGGGGGSAPQGGGLMLRPHIGILYDTGKYNVGLSLTKVKFPNGDIDSNQVSLNINFPFSLIHEKNIFSKITLQEIDNLIGTTGKKIGWQDHYFAVTMQRYMPGNGSKTTSGAKMNSNMTLVGFEYGTKLNRNIFSFVEAAGAGGGDTDGYAEILGGLGYTKQIKTHSGIYVKAALGASGGGRVDTGGGIIAKESIGIYSKLMKNLILTTEVGHIDAIGGNFHAFTLKTSLNYGVKFLSFGKSLRSIEGYTLFNDKEWNIRISNQTYLDKNSKDSKINLIGFKIDRYISDNTYLSGEALGAYNGKSGGYAVGLLGVGKRYMINNSLSAFGEFLIGGAGGGGVDVGGGLIYQPMVGLEYKLRNNLGVQLSFGKTKSISGSLDTNVLDFGFSYKFRTVE